MNHINASSLLYFANLTNEGDGASALFLYKEQERTVNDKIHLFGARRTA